jgi:cellulose synthase/poly-beta-1,6-N-acetylglucosamine synthase-like glycosyltransferase
VAGTIEAVLIAIGAVLAVPVLTLCLEIACGVARYTARPVRDGARPRVAVLVPAHNEERVLPRHLRFILSGLREGDRLVVIADNCSDNTADVARNQGAEVAVRCDPALRGKGYALDHGLEFLARTGAPEVVICIDADCEIGTDGIDRLARACAGTRRPLQAAYIMNPPQAAGRFAAIVVFAWLVKDYLRPLGLHRLGLPCQLMGTGMAFLWDDIRSVNLKNANLVEDLALGLDLALDGKFPRFCPGARVISDVAAGGTPSFAQRARWEHGTIATAIRYVPVLVGRLCRTGDVRLLAMMLDLIVPPLALLLLLLAGYFVLAATLYALSASAAPLALAVTNAVLFLAAIGVAWWGHGRDIVPLRTLALAPVYALAKVPLYLRLFGARQTAWVRGKRGVRTDTSPVRAGAVSSTKSRSPNRWQN